MSAEQAVEADLLVRDGYAVAVCWDTMTAIQLTESYLRGELAPALFVMRAEKPARRRAPARPR